MVSVEGVGIDVMEMRRFRGLSNPRRVAELCLTESELEAYSAHPDSITYLASRFVLKEAVIKAYPTELTFRDIEISKVGKKPIARIMGGGNHHALTVSLSHSTDTIAGIAIVQRA